MEVHIRHFYYARSSFICFIADLRFSGRRTFKFLVMIPCYAVFGYRRFGGPCCLCIKGYDVGTTIFRKIGILPQNCTMLQPRRLRI